MANRVIHTYTCLHSVCDSATWRASAIPTLYTVLPLSSLYMRFCRMPRFGYTTPYGVLPLFSLHMCDSAVWCALAIHTPYSILLLSSLYMVFCQMACFGYTHSVYDSAIIVTLYVVLPTACFGYTHSVWGSAFILTPYV